MRLEVGMVVNNQAKLSRPEYRRRALQRRWGEALLGEGGSFQRGKGSTACVTDQGACWGGQEGNASGADRGRSRRCPNGFTFR
jgi:hypothetical protein